MERTLGDLGEQLGKSPVARPRPPELSADPVADLALAVSFKEQEVSGDLVLEEDRLLHPGFVGEDLLP